MKRIEVRGLDDPGIRVYTGLNEKQVKRIYEPRPGLFICESEKVIRRALEAGYEPESFFADAAKEKEARALIGDREDVCLYLCDAETMRHITGYALTGGILAALKRRPLPKAEKLLETASNIVLLDDVENPTNVGAIFRSAAALGADAVLLTAECADPLYRRAARVSMGSVFQIPWTQVSEDSLTEWKRMGVPLIALALSEDAREIDDPGIRALSKKILILGNEDHGVRPSLLSKCDFSVKIPMQKNVDSLNVAAASAVAFWTLFR